MPRRVFHDICFHIAWHTKNDLRLEMAARDKASGREDQKTAGRR